MLLDVALSLLVSAPAPSLSGQDHAVKAAPFTAVRWTGAAPESPRVEVDGRWYGWTAIDDVPVHELIRVSKESWPTKWRKRVGEDLVEVLVLLGAEPRPHVDLTLVELATNEPVVLERVSMTKEKRRAVWRANQRGADRPATVQRVAREHGAPSAEAPSLRRFVAWSGWTEAPSIARAQAEEDLDQLEWLVVNTHSYRDLRGVDIAGAFDTVRAGLGERVPVGSLAVQLDKLLALLGDGHAGVSGLDAYLPSGYLPFLLADGDAGVVAFMPDRSSFVDPDRPYLLSIDGRPVDEWVAAVAPLVPVGSPQNVRYRALRRLRHLDYARLELGVALSPRVRVRLAAAGGGDPREVTLSLAGRKPIYGTWPTRSSGRLPDDVGYLRIPAMDGSSDFLRELEGSMAELADTRGLVIDVRGNGGGSRAALRELLPFFLPPEDGPRVVNVAAYRLPPGEARGRPEGYLQNRTLFPTSADWRPAERAAIEAVAGTFRPDWTPPAEDFSAWHYFVISPDEASRHYDRPAALLLDTGCFSATDIFLAAFRGLPNVVSLGTRSGGGSGRTKRTTLAHSGISVRLSSMASFRPDGTRYDGVGIHPEVTRLPVATDFLEDGTDSLLDAALEHLSR